MRIEPKKASSTISALKYSYGSLCLPECFREDDRAPGVSGMRPYAFFFPAFCGSPDSSYEFLKANLRKSESLDFW